MVELKQITKIGKILEKKDKKGEFLKQKEIENYNII